MTARLDELQAKRDDLATRIKNLADTSENWGAEDKATWDVINAEYDDNLTLLTTERTAVEASAAEDDNRRQRLEEISGYKPFVANSKRPQFGRDGSSLDGGPKGNGGVANHALALQGWMRMGHDPSDVGNVTDEHRQAAAACGFSLNNRSSCKIPLHNDFSQVRNALSSQDGSSGGFTYGDTFVANLERAMLAYGGMLNVAEIIRTNGAEPMRWPTANDTQNTGRQIGEGQPVTPLDPTFGQVIWNAYKFTSDEIYVPFELLRDNAVNLTSVLSEMLGQRLGRIQNSKATNGTGAATMRGITVAAAAGNVTASSTAIAFDEVIDLEHSLDPSRRMMPGVGYMFHDNILKALRKLKTGTGEYLWQQGSNTGAPDTLNRYPYTINQDMASAISTGQITMLFGQMSQYKIRQVGGIRLYRLTERARENDQDVFLAFMEADGNLLNAGDNPVKKMTQL
jgi:HK97 family phage major capsid protein